MVREVITINIGECGVKLGYNVWKQYCREHNINEKGMRMKNDNDNSFLCFFEERNGGEFLPRNLMVDLEENIIDEIKTNKYGTILVDGEYLLSGKEDAGYNFARGHYKLGRDIIDKVNDRLRKLVDNCDNVQGFMLNHSVGGGTGSGLGALILERIAVDYRKKVKIGFEIYPFNNHHQSNCIVEPYNALLTTHWLLDYTETSFLFDNRKIYNLCKNNLEIKIPNYNDINSLITKVESSLTASLRYEGELNVDLNEYHTNTLVPFPRLHFITPSMSPLVNDRNIEKVAIAPQENQILVDGFIRCNWSYPENEIINNKNINVDLLQYEAPIYQDLLNLIYKSYSDKFKEYDKKFYELDCVYDLLEMCADSDYFMIEYNDYNVEKDKAMSNQTNCIGNIKSKQMNEGIQKLKINKKVSFVEWCPTGFKCGLNQNCIPWIDGDIVEFKDKMVVMCQNNTAISRFFQKRICVKYDLMYSQRAFVHWYVNQGMEEGEFAESREDLGFLEKDYLDVLYEQSTDDVTDDDNNDDDY